MPYTTLISTTALTTQLNSPDWVILDCRFNLAQPEEGETLYRTAHIPGARYAHVDRDLSGVKTGRNGRHPLPDMEIFKTRLAAWGITPTTQVIAYDQHNGVYASRAWWLLRYLGHTAVAVLEGGFAKWQREGHPTSAGEEKLADVSVNSWANRQPDPTILVTLATVEQLRLDPAWRLVDSRAPDRFAGQNETLDPVAGHIPDAVNHFYLNNVQSDGTFLPIEQLRANFQNVLGATPLDQVVVYCGSGVTACHNLLALEVAGLVGAKLYPGSWSEWCAEPQRPVASVS